MKKIKVALILIPILFAISLSIFHATKRILPKNLGSRVYSKENSTVGVTAVPKQLFPGREMIFTINSNNHPTDLYYDHTSMALVVDGEGNIYKPVSWTGGDGERVTGDLIFGKLDKSATHVGLNIKGVDNKNVNFDWEL